MYKIFHNIDGEKTTVCNSDLEFIDFVKLIAFENEDFDFSILGISDAEEYLNEYCSNLDLLTYNGYQIEPNNTGYVNFDFYKPEDEIISGNGKTIEDCKNQIYEIISTQ